jgi:hypothetical protein
MHSVYVNYDIRSGNDADTLRDFLVDDLKGQMLTNSVYLVKTENLDRLAKRLRRRVSDDDSVYMIFTDENGETTHHCVVDGRVEEALEDAYRKAWREAAATLFKHSR